MILPAPGILLIADPFLKDPNFLRTVVLICEHDEHGSFGLVLNKPIDFTLNQLLEGFDAFKLPVFSGGPMEAEKLFFVHQCPQLIPNAIELCNGIYWGGNFETLTALVKNKSIDLKKVKFFVGYSGWDKQQLEDEIEEKSWVTVQTTKDLVFNTTSEAVWKESLIHLGGQYKMMVNFPVDPQLN